MRMSDWSSYVCSSDLMPALIRTFRVLRYDTRGHGLSGLSPTSYGVDRLGRDVLALMDELEIGQAAFCGLSMGGMTGMWLGVHAPSRFRDRKSTRLNSSH